MEESEFFYSKVISDVNASKRQSGVIVANQLTNESRDMSDRMYTRNLFRND